MEVSIAFVPGPIALFADGSRSILRLEDRPGPSAPKRSPRGLVSLWDMLRFHADRFSAVMNLLARMQSSLQALAPFLRERASRHGPYKDEINSKLMLEHVGALGGQLDAIGLSMSKATLDRIDASIRMEKVNLLEMEHLLKDLQTRIEDEFQSVIFLSLSSDEKPWYEPSKPLMGVEVERKFPGLLFEIDEAGKCQALGRHTAAVFHPMRVMEVALKATATCLGIPDPIKPADRNRGAILRTIKDEISRRGSAKPSAWSINHDREFFGELYTSLDSVRNSWRNSTMHVDKKYTDEESQHIFAAVRGLMMKIAVRFDESGLPQA